MRSSHYTTRTRTALCIVLTVTVGFPIASSAFIHQRRQAVNCLSSAKLPSQCHGDRSTTELNLLSWFSSKQMPWSNKENSGTDDNEDVWGSSSDKSKDPKKNLGSSDSNNNKSGLGGVAGIMDSMENFKTAQQVGKMTNSLVQELASTTVEGVAVEGKVKVVFDGQQRPLNVQIDDGYLDTADSSDLSAALTTAMKDAYRKSSERMDEKMKSFYVDLGLK